MKKSVDRSVVVIYLVDSAGEKTNQKEVTK